MSSLNLDVLVLNKVWMPIRIIKVKRCIKLVFADRASIVDPDDYSIYNWDKWTSLPIPKGEDYISTTRNNVRVPELIVLSRYDKTHRRSLRLTKRNIYLRDGHVCQYTGQKINKNNGDIDHIVPRSKGGKNTWDNVVACLKDINRQKGNRTPEEAGLKLLRKPKKPHYDHLLIDPKITIRESWKKFIKVK